MTTAQAIHQADLWIELTHDDHEQLDRERAERTRDRDGWHQAQMEIWSGADLSGCFDCL